MYRLALAALILVVAAPAQAQDFGVMESAQTINRGNFKIKANPMVVFGESDLDNETGVALAAGYGVTERFDIEGKLAFYDGVVLFGGDFEVGLLSALRGNPLDFALSAGFHVANSDFDLDDQRGFDVTLLASREIAPRFELYGALDMAFNELTDDFFGDQDDSNTTVHLVPGIEYRINETIDFLTEFGIKLNDDSAHYFSAGLAIYFR